MRIRATVLREPITLWSVEENRARPARAARNPHSLDEVNEGYQDMRDNKNIPDAVTFDIGLP